MNDEQPTGYDVENLNFAAVLLCFGIKVIGTKPHPKKDYLHIFIFENDDSLSAMHREYLAKNLSVEPRAYGDAIRTLKEMVHGSKEK